MKRILACIDASSYAASVCDLTAWAAERLSAEVELLHVHQRRDAVAARNDLSGAIGLGVKSELLEELTRIDEAEGRLAIEKGRVLLEGTACRLKEKGIGNVHMLHRHGGIVETIIEREEDTDLVIIGKRGASSEFASDHIGSKIERVVRSSVKPVLIASREIRPISTAVIAFDASPASMRAVEHAAKSDLFNGLSLHLVMAGAEDDANREKLAAAAAMISEARKAADAPVTYLENARAEKVIGSYMEDRTDAFLVMGAYGHSPLRTLIVGSTTTAMIRTVKRPVLLVR